MYCFRCMSSPCRCNRRQRIQPLAAPITEYPAKISSPKDVSDLLFWFRADLGVILSGLVVKRWEDQSGNGHHLEAHGEPALIPGDGEYNQKAAIRFDGNYSYFTNDTLAEQAQPYTLFIVCDGQNTEWEGVFIAGTAEVIGEFQFYSDITPSPIGDPSGQHAAVGYASDYLGAYGSECDTRSPHVYCITVNGASAAIYVDGFKSPIATGDIGDGSLTGLAIGNGQFVPSGYVYPLIGRIAEVIGYSGAMSEANRGSVMRYLRERYATPVTAEGTGFQIVGLVAPTVTAINPASGLITGGYTVDITVSNSSECTSATVNGVALTGFTIVDSTTVRGTTGTGMSIGSGDVTVTNSAGTGTLTNGFTGQWTPATASVPLRAWYRMDDAVVSGGGTVSSLADRSGSGDSNRNLHGTVSAPTYVASDANYNGHPTAQGNGSSMHLEPTGNWSGVNPFQPPVTYVVVGHAFSITALISDGPDGGGTRNLLWIGSGGVPQLYSDPGSNAMNATTGVSGAPCVLMVTDDGSASADAAKIYVNNLGTQEGSRATLVKSIASGLYLMLGNAGVPPCQGRIAEVIGFSGIPTPTDISNLVTYLNDRYDLGVTS